MIPVRSLWPLPLLLAALACGPTDPGPDAGPCDPDAEELCNFVDDDCDGEIDEDFPLYGTECDGPDSDSCLEGLFTCNPAGDGLACSDTTAGSTERCNGADDDCDGEIDEDFALGQSCDGPDADLCSDDVTVCNSTGERIICANRTPDVVELCNGKDDDCDGLIDEDFEIGVSCDGADADQCKEGTFQCDPAGTGRVCSDDTADNVERCNYQDDDCDGQQDEGFANLGAPCDGVDIDSCLEGSVVCNLEETGTLCNDPNENAIETCNGIDDDCDGQTDENYQIGVACDGNDADLCADGEWVCTSATSRACNDDAASNPEICDEQDNDCDGQIDEGLVCCSANGGFGNPVCQPEIGETCGNCGDCRSCGDGCCSAPFEDSINCPQDC